MGVYVFRSRESDWIKVGHHRVSPSRPNVYYRIARRGFHSCVHPRELDERLDEEHFDLVRWYPTLARRDETAAHRACAVSVGEFHPAADLERVLTCLDARGASVAVSPSARAQALVWARR